MVVAGKVFKLAEPLGLAEVAERLQDYHVEEEFTEGDYTFPLVTEVVGLSVKANMLRGIYSHDFVLRVFHRGKVVPQPRTVEAVFCLSTLNDTTFLTIVERKRTANFVANKLSELLFEKAGHIVEARISPETLKDFHLKNPEDTKITFFDNVDIPNVNKLSLYGPDLINTSLFEDYAKHGDLWYVVARNKEYGYVVGITRDASVTIFNLPETEKEKYLEFTIKQICPLTT
ncbi:MAG: hypothetical protein QW840_01755 [Candidatus Bathyarchaeia archaeon]